MNGTQLKKLIEDSYKDHPQVWVIRTNATNGRNFKIKSLPTGFSDLTILIMGGITIFAETKSENEKQRDKQGEFQSRVQALGFEYWLIDSFEDFQGRVHMKLRGAV